jgi:hypothetical protein
MIKITTIQNETEINQLLALQQANLGKNISKETALQQGFVTVEHHFDLLKAMNEAMPQIIAKEDDRVVGYALVMPPSFGGMIPELVPMFNLFEKIEYKHQKVNALRYYVMGQICVGEGYRGLGIFDKMYEKHRILYAAEYDICITEVAVRNERSMRAHERVGFQTFYTYEDHLDIWNVIAWDWK